MLYGYCTGTLAGRTIASLSVRRSSTSTSIGLPGFTCTPENKTSGLFAREVRHRCGITASYSQHRTVATQPRCMHVRSRAYSQAALPSGMASATACDTWLTSAPRCTPPYRLFAESSRRTGHGGTGSTARNSGTVHAVLRQTGIVIVDAGSAPSGQCEAAQADVCSRMQ